MEPVYRLAELLLRRPLHHGVRWTVETISAVPATGPVLLASNHISYFDPLAIAYLANRAGRRVRFLTKAELFEKAWMARVMRGLGEIPVERGSGDATDSLGRATAALAAGEMVAVFPEGTIASDFEPMAGKTGVARLARAAGMPIVPLGLWGTHRILNRGHRIPLGMRVAVTAVFGDPVAVGPGDNPREATDRIMGAVCAQVARARALYPQGPRSEADEWWVRRPGTVRLRSCRGRVAQEMLDRAAPDSE
ncbi:MAG: lysophospholipid acyltransferase family protein [Acidimicrobiia bacterium]